MLKARQHLFFPKLCQHIWRRPSVCSYAFASSRVEVSGPQIYQISVNTGNEIEMTYDDSRDQYWLYRAPQSPPHPSEIFHVKELQSGKIRIYGFTYKPSVKWYLTVEEHSNGRVEEFPRFRNLDGISQADSGSIMHKSFTPTYSEGFFSLGFKKRNNKEMVYMKPTTDEKRIQTTHEERYCFQVPDVPLTDEYLLSLNIDWHLIVEARVELEGN